MAAQVLDWKK